MTTRTPNRMIQAILVTSLALTAVPIAIGPAEAKNSSPIIRDHRTPKWNPPSGPGGKHNKPTVRDHRSPTWQPQVR